MAFSRTTSNFEKKHRQKKQIKKSETSMLFGLFVFSLLALGALITIKMTPEYTFSIGQFFSSYYAKPKPPLMLGQVELGTKLSAIRTTHPDATKGISRSGDITMTFAANDAAYMVWYGEDGDNHIAYKARQTRDITGVSEDEFVGNLTRRLSAPSLATCSRRIADGIRDCQFSWWLPKSIRVDLNSRQYTIGNTPKLRITMQITNTRMASRLQRTAQRTAVFKTY